MAANDSVVQHVAKVQNMARQLTDVGEVVSETAVMAKILGSLPAKFGALITAWDSVEPISQTIHKLQERLIKEENRLSQDEEVSNALATVTNKKKGNTSTERKIYSKPRANSPSTGKEMRATETRDCFYCKKVGHIKKFCRKWIKDGKPEHSDADKENEKDACAFVTASSEDNKRNKQKCNPRDGGLTTEQLIVVTYRIRRLKMYAAPCKGGGQRGLGPGRRC